MIPAGANGGLAILTTSLPTGNHSISVSYPGDPNFAPSGATNLFQVSSSSGGGGAGGGGGGSNTPPPVSPPVTPPVTPPVEPPATSPGGGGSTGAGSTAAPPGPRGPEKTRTGGFSLPAGVRQAAFETVTTRQGQREILLMDPTTGAELLRLPTGKGPGNYRVLAADLNRDGVPERIFYAPRVGKGKVLVQDGLGELFTFFPFGKRFKGRMRVRVKDVNGVPQVFVSTGQGGRAKVATLGTQVAGGSALTPVGSGG